MYCDLRQYKMRSFKVNTVLCSVLFGIKILKEKSRILKYC